MTLDYKQYEVNENDDLASVLQWILDKQADFVVIVSDDDYPVGVISYSDAVNYFGEKEGKKAGDIMSQSFIKVRNLRCLEEELEKNDYQTEPMVLVNEDGKYVETLTNANIISILHRNLKYTKKILDNIDEGIIAIDENNNIAFMNESYKQIHSIDEVELIGAGIKDKFPESKLGTSDLTRKGGPLYLNFTGATVIPSYKQIVDDENQQLGAMAIVKDYSKMNDFYIGVNKVGKINILFSFVFDQLSEAVFYVDREFKVLYANKRFESISNVRVGDVLEDGALKNMLLTMGGEIDIDGFEHEISIEVEEGEFKKYKCMGIPLVDSDQFVDGVVVILSDITHYERLHKEFRKRGKLLDYYKKQINKLPEDMICESENFKETIATALKVAATDVTVLIEGENGVGKELVATLIHNNSRRSNKPFIPVNCGAIPEELWESEMFGYEEGSFTGAKRGGKIGIFEIADGGTLFLDEIGEMSLSTQVKLLRFLQNMEVAKVGRKEIKKVDVRIIAATNKSIEKLVEEGSFRIDLYYRLNVVNLRVPPLRERIDEIGLLARKFVSIFNARYDKNVKISDETIRVLEKGYWPGNIRQLRNVIEQSVIMSDGTIERDELPLDYIYDKEEDARPDKLLTPIVGWDIPEHVAEIEKVLIKSALEETKNNKSKAIELLNISRKTFYKKLKEYDLE